MIQAGANLQKSNFGGIWWWWWDIRIIWFAYLDDSTVKYLYRKYIGRPVYTLYDNRRIFMKSCGSLCNKPVNPAVDVYTSGCVTQAFWHWHKLAPIVGEHFLHVYASTGSPGHRALFWRVDISRSIIGAQSRQFDGMSNGSMDVSANDIVLVVVLEL
jgi:hypothetical protein